MVVGKVVEGDIEDKEEGLGDVVIDDVDDGGAIKGNAVGKIVDTSTVVFSSNSKKMERK